MLIVCGCAPSDLSREKTMDVKSKAGGEEGTKGDVLPIGVQVVIPQLLNAKAWLGAGEGPTGFPPYLHQATTCHQLVLKLLFLFS